MAHGMDMDMGRHTIINPATGRSILKTGALGRLVQKMQTQSSLVAWLW